MFTFDQIDDFILEIGVDHVLRQDDIVLAGIIDQVLQGFMKPVVLLVLRIFGRRLLEDIDLGADPVRQCQRVTDAPEVIGGRPDGDQNLILVHGCLPLRFLIHKKCARYYISNIFR